jgi:hypothetical protein
LVPNPRITNLVIILGTILGITLGTILGTISKYEAISMSYRNERFLAKFQQTE